MIRSAARIFDRDGYALSTLQDICAEALMSKGALYVHFPEGKRTLADAVEGLALDEVRRALDRTGAGSAMQRLIDGSHALATAVEGDVVVRAGFVLGCDRARRGTATAYSAWRDFVRHALDAARVEGVTTTSAAAAGAEPVIITMPLLGVITDIPAVEPAAWWRLILPQLVTAAALPTLTPTPSAG